MGGFIADVGGTWARFGLVGADGTVGRIAVRECREYVGFAESAADYLQGLGPAAPRPRRAAVAVACPVMGDRVTLTNHPWSFSIEETRSRFGFDTLAVVNDFSAVARGIPHLGNGDLVQVGGGRPVAGAALAVLGPGTGLGVSGLIPAGDGGWAILEGEGGHVTMSAADAREMEVLAVLAREFGHVSAERVLSGPGLVNLYSALCRVDGDAPERAPTSHEVMARGLARTSSRCREALKLAAGMLGAFAANLALTLGARGGVYVGGGIVPRHAAAFARSGFRRRFEDKGRFSEYLSAIPTYVVLHEFPAFLGLASLVRGSPEGA